MVNTDIAKIVNAFMLSNAPNLTEATPMAYDLLKALATELIFHIKTTREHAIYVMNNRYGYLYNQACIATIIDEAFAEEINGRMRLGQKRREKRLLARQQPSQPVLLTA